MSFKLSDYVKLAPWLQFVGHMLVLLGVVLVLLHYHWAVWLVIAANIGAGGAFRYQWHKGMAPKIDAVLRTELQLGGVSLTLVGGILLFFIAPAGALCSFIGTAAALAGFCYDLLYP